VILPSKHLSLNRSLLSVGGRVLAALSEERTVSGLWNDLKNPPSFASNGEQVEISFDWFVLALDFLFTAGAIELYAGMIRRTGP
jgi:hypothetical protein